MTFCRLPIFILELIAILYIFKFIPLSLGSQYQFDTLRILDSFNGADCMVFSKDGKTLYTGSTQTSGVILWQIPDGTNYSFLSTTSGSIYGLAISSDGNTLATAGGGIKPDTCIFRVGTQNIYQTISGRGNIVALNAEGTMLAKVKLFDDNIYLWSVDGKLLKTFEGHTNTIQSIAFSADSNTLLSGGYDGCIRLWRISDGSQIKVFKPSLTVYFVAFMNDGKSIMSVVSSDVGIACINAEDGSIIWNRPYTSGLQICSVTISDDKSLLAIGNYGYLNVYSTLDGAKLYTLNIPYDDKSFIGSLAFSPDNTYLAAGSDDYMIRLWRIKDQKLIKTFGGHDEIIKSIVITRDESKLITADCDNVNFWRLSDMNNLLHLNRGHEVLSISPDSRLLALTGSGNSYGLDVIKVKNGEYVWGDYNSTSQGHFSSVAFSDNGNVLAVGDDYGILEIIDTSNGHIIRQYDTGQSGIGSIAFSSDGAIIATAGYDDTVKLWKSDNYTLIFTLIGHRDPVNSVAFCINRNILASGGDDGCVRIWRTSDGVEIANLREYAGPVRSVTFSPDGTLLAAAGKNKVNIWRVEDYSLLQSINDDSYSITFSPSGRMILYSGLFGWLFFLRNPYCCDIPSFALDPLVLMPSGRLGLSVNSAFPIKCLLQISSNLIDWEDWTNISITNNHNNINVEETNNSHRFYRGVRLF